MNELAVQKSPSTPDVPPSNPFHKAPSGPDVAPAVGTAKEQETLDEG